MAVQRILERDHPEPAGGPPGPLGGNGATVLGEVEAGSLTGYGHLDEDPVSERPGDDVTQRKSDKGDANGS